jgi:aldehyde dehydrogenase (NAD+)
MLIDGALLDASDGRAFDNVDPATEQVIGVVADGGPLEIERAIAAARRAFDETSWSTDLPLRATCLRQLRDALDAARDEFRDEMVAEVGCTISSTYSSRLDPPIDRSFDWYLELLERFAWERDAGVLGAPAGASRRIVHKEAVGVIGAITAWNSPLELALSKLAPALATGNTVVLKPSPEAPFSTTRLGRIIAERTDLPVGVVNVVTSSDHALGGCLSSDPRVDMISFTGSVATGRRIMRDAADTLKRLQFELGGKAAHVVLDDAELAPVLARSMNVTVNAGQSCGAQSRLLLPRAFYDEAVERLAEAFAAVRVGAPSDPETVMGPLISETQRRRMLQMVARARDEGARVVTGGGVPAQLARGYFVEPTLLADVDPRSEIAQEEVFGPVLCAIPYDDDADAVRIANGTPYGLTAAVSGSPERALDVARRLRAGAVSVNGGAPFARDVPFGGYKQSGIGRQNGPEGIDEMLEAKTVAYPAT